MISYAAALEIIGSLKSNYRSERVPLDHCLGRVLAKSLHARIPSPPFTNSAMDGFAVNSKSMQTGVSLKVQGAVFARPLDGLELPEPPAGSCVRIMTGAPMPTWADAVLPVEKSVLAGDKVTFLETSSPGDHVRKIGEDISEGSSVLAAYSVMKPELVMIAAAFGHTHIDAVVQPRVVIISTGDELKDPGSQLKPGEIYNSSKYFLAAAARSVGLTDISSFSVSDNIHDARQAIASECRDSDPNARPTIVVTTGAVSAGEKDFVPDLAFKLGFETLFHKVAIRPGKPVFAAKRGIHLWLGLPGNPISTAATWHYFGRPFLAAWAGLPEPRKITAVLAKDVRKPTGLRCFFRAYFDGVALKVYEKQGSSHFSASTEANAYVELPEDDSVVTAGTAVQAILI